MTVKELIKELTKYPSGTTVLIGDYEENHHELNDVDSVELSWAKKLDNGFWDYPDDKHPVSEAYKSVLTIN